MNKRTYLMALPLLLLVVAVVGCIRGVTGDSPVPVGDQAQDGASHVTVDPRVEESLEESEWVSVYISIGAPPGFELPSYELYESDPDAYKEIILGWDLDVYDQLRAERRANVLSALGPDYQQRLHAGDFVTASGLEKLRNHPYVVAVLWPTGELAEGTLH